jgi:hypothetical protein
MSFTEETCAPIELADTHCSDKAKREPDAKCDANKLDGKITRVRMWSQPRKIGPAGFQLWTTQGKRYMFGA